MSATVPGTKRDRARLRKLAPDEQQRVTERVAELRKSGLVLAKAWPAALDEALPQTRLEPVVKTMFAPRFIHGGRALTGKECWAAKSEDGVWYFERLEQAGTPWEVTHVPSLQKDDGRTLRWFGTLDQARLYVGSGEAAADVERIRAHRRGEHTALSESRCLACF